MRVNLFTAAFAEIGQLFRRSTTDKNQALRDFSIPGIREDRVSLSDKAIQKLSDTKLERVGKETIATSSYYFVERRVPKVELLDSAASAYQVHSDLEFLRQEKTRIPIVDNLPLRSPFIKKQIKSFLKISEKLSSLKNAIKNVSQAGNFNIKSAKSSNTDALTATTTAKSSVDNFKINISRLAGGQQLVSDAVSDPFAGLGASGAIQINGFEVNIETSDSLDDIKNKINFGEDLNKNGVLDLEEDLNKNGILEVLQVASNSHAKGIYIIEDINGDNVIQGSEDSNGNELLDGGVAELEVVASIIDNRLFLESLSNVHKKIELQDHNDVLFDLGFFELDRDDNAVLKEQQLDPDTFENLNMLPTTSSLTVDGDSFEKAANEISDIIPETTLRLKDTSSRDISLSISTDLTETLKNIKNFVSAYNDTIKFLNNELAFSRVLEEDVSTQKMRNRLNDKTMDDVLNADQKFNNLEEIGITSQNQSKNTFNQIAIKNLVTNFKSEVSNMVLLPSKGSSSIFAGLGKIGIRTMEDDTLTIDERELKKVLEKNAEKVITLFTDASSGIAEKLDGLISILTRPLSGTIAQKTVNKNNLLSNISFASDLIKSTAKVQATQFDKSTQENVIFSVTA
tara:strand:- start:8840 stop:10717 length:1878 start_codon:yes stop_codon:yes gene_type:complete